MSKKDEGLSHHALATVLSDSIIRIGIIGLTAVLCLRIFSPFLGLLLWALILAVTLYPIHRKVAAKLGGNQGRAATTVVVSVLLLIGTPMAIVGESFASQLQHIYTKFEQGDVTIDPPSESVAQWPIIGEKTYRGWSAAAENLPGFIESHNTQVKSLSKNLVAAGANTATSLLAFLGSLIVAGIMMAYGESGHAAMRNIFNRFAGASKGEALQKLSVSTVRSVASGVIGVAFIQALLLGVGFVLAGIPAAGLWAFFVLILGVMQLPAALVSLPAIAYLWMGGDASTTSNIMFTVYLVIAGLADNILKPLLLGRGVDAPMPVILLGALGGMITSGIIGLFVGAVLMAIGYEVFMAWVDEAVQPEPESDVTP